MWIPLDYIDKSTITDESYMVFDSKNNLLLFSVPGTQNFVSASFETDRINTNYIQNQNSVPNPCCSSWYFDEVEAQVILMLKERNLGKFHAFAFNDGIPKPDLRKGQSYYHSKDWYELGHFRGIFSQNPDSIQGNYLYKKGIKYDSLQLPSR